MKAAGTGRSTRREASRGAGSARPSARSLGRVTVLALTMALIVGPFAVTGKAASCPPLEPKDWVSLPVPDFPEGNQVILDFEVSYTDPSLLFVTNGHSVLASSDAGCSFHESFVLDGFEAGFDTGKAEITDLHLASDDGRRVYLAVRALDRVEEPELPELGLPDVPPVDLPVERPHMIVSGDGGKSWTLSDAGLEEAFGPPLSIASTRDSGSAYLLVDQEEVETDAGPRIFTPQKLYASTSSGASWTETMSFGDPAGIDANSEDAQDGRLYEALESDPSDEKALWAYGPGGIDKSVDGGASFLPDGVFDALASLTGVSGMETYAAPKGPTQLLVFPTGRSEVHYSDNGGTTFVPHPEPGPIESGALTEGLRFAAATTTGEVYYHFPTVNDPSDISIQDPIGNLHPVVSDGTDLIYGNTINALVRRVVPKSPPGPVWEFPEEEIFKPDVGPFPDIGDRCDLPQALLLPDRRRIVMEPGEARTLPYRVAIPGVIQADVAFLSDVSWSMDAEIEGLRVAMGDIVDLLEEAGVCIWGGVGQYRDYGSIPYQRLRDIGPIDDGFREALAEMVASGGDEQSTFAALSNLATGEGSTADGRFITSDQQMNFRDGILHVVVHGTDEEPTEGLEQPPLTYESVGEVLNGVGARHIGLAYENPTDITSPNTEGPPTEALKRFSTRTNAFAREELDCTGDGQIDLQPGDPLTCVIPQGSVAVGRAMGSAITNMIAGLPDVRTVTLEAIGGDALQTGVGPSAYNSIDFRVSQQMAFDVTVRCPTGVPDDEYSMDLSATARTVSIAHAELVVECRSLIPPYLPPPAEGDRVVPAIPPVLFPPSRPPQLSQPPVTQSPVQQTQAQQQAQQQMQAQAGMVAQRQEQPQVAAVKVMKPSANLARADGGGADELSFRGYEPKRHGDPPLYLFGWVVAAVSGSAFGLVIRARARKAYVVARAKNRARARRTLRHWN